MNLRYKALFCSYVNGKRKLLFFLVLILLASVISAFFSLDSAAYQRIFLHISSTGMKVFLEELNGYEAFFILTAKALHGESSFIWFLMIASLAVSFKLMLMVRTSRCIEMSFAFYLSYFFVLLDGTQIRVSLAIAIAYWGGYFFCCKRRVLGIFLVFCSFLFFHYSLVFFLFFLMFRNDKLSFYIIFSYLILTFFWFFDFTVLGLIGETSNFIGSAWVGFYKFFSYIKQSDPNSAPYSSQFIVLFLATIYIFYRYQKKLTEFEVFCFNSVFFSFLILALLVGASAIQNRLSEIFRFSIVFIFPLYYRALSEILKSEKKAKVLIYIALLAYFCVYIVGAGLFVIPNE